MSELLFEPLILEEVPTETANKNNFSSGTHLSDVLRAPALHFDWANPNFDASVGVRNRKSSVAPRGSLASVNNLASQQVSSSTSVAVDSPMSPNLHFVKDKNDVTQRTAFIENVIRRRALADVMGRNSQWIAVTKKVDTPSKMNADRTQEGRLELGGGNINTSNGATAVGLFETKEELAARLAKEYKCAVATTLSTDPLGAPSPLTERSLSQSALLPKTPGSSPAMQTITAGCGRFSEAERAHKLQIQNEESAANFLQTISLARVKQLTDAPNLMTPAPQENVIAENNISMNETTLEEDTTKSQTPPRRQRKVVFSEAEDTTLVTETSSPNKTEVNDSNIAPALSPSSSRPKTPPPPRDVHLSHRVLLNFVSLGKPKKWSDHRYNKVAQKLRETLETQFDLFPILPKSDESSTTDLASFLQKHQEAVLSSTAPGLDSSRATAPTPRFSLAGNFALLEAKRALVEDLPPPPPTGILHRSAFLSKLINADNKNIDLKGLKVSDQLLSPHKSKLTEPNVETKSDLFQSLIEFVVEAQNEMTQQALEREINYAPSLSQNMEEAKPRANHLYKYDRLIHEHNVEATMDNIIRHYTSELTKAAENKRMNAMETATITASTAHRAAKSANDDTKDQKRHSVATLKATKIVHNPEDPQWDPKKRNSSVSKKTKGSSSGRKRMRRQSKSTRDNNKNIEEDDDSSDDGAFDEDDAELSQMLDAQKFISSMLKGENLSNIERLGIVRAIALRKGDDLASFVQRASSPLKTIPIKFEENHAKKKEFISTDAFGEETLASVNTSPKLSESKAAPPPPISGGNNTMISRTVSGFGSSSLLAARRPSLAQPVSRFDESLVFDEKEVIMTLEERQKALQKDEEELKRQMDLYQNTERSVLERRSSLRRGVSTSYDSVAPGAPRRASTTVVLVSPSDGDNVSMAASIESPATNLLNRNTSNVGALFPPRSIAGSSVSLLGGNASTSMRDLKTADPNSRYHLGVAATAPYSWLSRAYDGNALLPYKTSRGSGAGANTGDEAEEGMVSFGNIPQAKSDPNNKLGTSSGGSSSQLLSQQHVVPSQPSKHFADALQWLSEAMTAISSNSDITTSADDNSTLSSVVHRNSNPAALLRRKAATKIKALLAPLLTPAVEEMTSKDNSTRLPSAAAENVNLNGLPSMSSEGSLALLLHWLDDYESSRSGNKGHISVGRSLAASDFCVVPIEARDEVQTILKGRGIPKINSTDLVAIASISDRKESLNSVSSDIIDLGATKTFNTTTGTVTTTLEENTNTKPTHKGLFEAPSVTLIPIQSAASGDIIETNSAHEDSKVSNLLESEEEMEEDDGETNDFENNKIIRGRSILLIPNGDSAADVAIKKFESEVTANINQQQTKTSSVARNDKQNDARDSAPVNVSKKPIAVLEYGVRYYLRDPKAKSNSPSTSLQLFIKPEDENEINYEELIDRIEFDDNLDSYNDAVATLRGTVDRALAAESEREAERRRQEVARWVELLAQFIKQMEAAESKARTDIIREEKNERFGPLEQLFSSFTLEARAIRDRELLWKDINQLTLVEEPQSRDQLLMWEHRVFSGLEDVELRARGMAMSTVKHVIVFPSFDLVSPEVHFFQRETLHIVFDEASEIVESSKDVLEGLSKTRTEKHDYDNEASNNYVTLSYRPPTVFLHSLVCKGMLDIPEALRLREGDGYGLADSSGEDEEEIAKQTSVPLYGKTTVSSGGNTPASAGLGTLSRKSTQRHQRRSTVATEKDALAAMTLMTDLEEAQYREALRRESRAAAFGTGGESALTAGVSRSPSISGTSQHHSKTEKHLKLLDIEETFLTDEQAIDLVLAMPTPPPSPRHSEEQETEDMFPTLRILRPEHVVGKQAALAMTKIIVQEKQNNNIGASAIITEGIHPLTLLLEAEFHHLKKQRLKDEACHSTTPTNAATTVFMSLPSGGSVSRVASSNAREGILTGGDGIDSPIVASMHPTFEPSSLATNVTFMDNGGVATPEAEGSKSKKSSVTSISLEKVVLLKPKNPKKSVDEIDLPITDLKTSGAMSTSALVGSLKEAALSLGNKSHQPPPNHSPESTLLIDPFDTSNIKQPTKKKESVAAKKVRLERERREAEAAAEVEFARQAEVQRAKELEETMKEQFAGGQVFFETTRVNEEEVAARQRRQKLEAYQAKVAERKARKLLGASGSGSLTMMSATTAAPSPRLHTGRPTTKSGLDGSSVDRVVSSTSDGRRLSVDSYADRLPLPSHWPGMSTSGSPLQSGLNSTLPSPGRPGGSRPPLAPHLYASGAKGGATPQNARLSNNTSPQPMRLVTPEEEAAEFNAILNALKSSSRPKDAEEGKGHLSLSTTSSENEDNISSEERVHEDLEKGSQDDQPFTNYKPNTKPNGAIVKTKRARDRTSSMDAAIKAHYEKITADAIANTFPSRDLMLHTWRFRPFGATVISLMQPTRLVLQRLIDRGGMKLEEDEASSSTLSKKRSSRPKQPQGVSSDTNEENIWWKVVATSGVENPHNSRLGETLNVTQFADKPQNPKTAKTTRMTKICIHLAEEATQNPAQTEGSTSQPYTAPLDLDALATALAKAAEVLAISGRAAPTFWARRQNALPRRIEAKKLEKVSLVNWKVTKQRNSVRTPDDIFTSTYVVRPHRIADDNNQRTGMMLLPDNLIMNDVSIGAAVPSETSASKPPKPQLPKSNPFSEETVLRDAPFFPHFLPKARPITSHAAATTSAAVRLQEAARKEKEVRAAAVIVSNDNDVEIQLTEVEKAQLSEGVPMTHLTPMEVVGADRRGPRSFLSKGTLSSRDDLSRIMGTATVPGRTHSTASRKQYVAKAANALLPPISPSLVAPLVKRSQQIEQDRVAASKPSVASVYGPQVGTPLRSATPAINVNGTIVPPSRQTTRLRPLSQSGCNSIQEALMSNQANQDANTKSVVVGDERESLRIQSMSIYPGRAKETKTTKDGEPTTNLRAPTPNINSDKSHIESRYSANTKGRRNLSAAPSMGSFRSVDDSLSANIATVKPTTHTALRSAVSSSVHLKAEQFALRHAIDRAADVQRDLLKLLEGLKWDMMR